MCVYESHCIRAGYSYICLCMYMHMLGVHMQEAEYGVAQLAEEIAAFISGRMPNISPLSRKKKVKWKVGRQIICIMLCMYAIVVINYEYC